MVAGEKGIETIKKIDFDFFGFNINWVASREKGIAFLIPLIAGLSAFILCFAQNRINVLQVEQSKFN